MTSSVNEHAQGNYAIHTGFPFIGHPSAGAWCNYGLGTENRTLPGFVVLQSGGAVPPHGGIGLFSNGFPACPAPGFDHPSRPNSGRREYRAGDWMTPISERIFS